jgi:hypothetical protein
MLQAIGAKVVYTSRRKAEDAPINFLPFRDRNSRDSTRTGRKKPGWHSAREHQICREGAALGEVGVIAEELQAAGVVGGHQLPQE